MGGGPVGAMHGVARTGMPARQMTNARSTEPECRLRTKGHQLLEKMPGLYDNASLSDVTFVVGQRRELHAHRVILAAVSDRFFNMFNSKHDARWHEKVLPMDDFDAVAFDLMLRYMYGQEIVFQGVDPASILLEVATHFEVHELINSIQAYLLHQVNAATCCILWNRAHRIQNKALETRCMDEMAMRLEEAAQCPGFLEVEEEGLTQVMQREDLQCTEEKVFEALLHWVNHRMSERESCIDNLLPLVRLSIIDPVYLQDSVDNNRLLRNSKKATKLLMEAYKYQASPAHRKLVLSGKLGHSTKPRQPQTGGTSSHGPLRQRTGLQYEQHQSVPMQQTLQITAGSGGWGRSHEHAAAGTNHPSMAHIPPTGASSMQQVHKQQYTPSSVRPGPSPRSYGTPAHNSYRSSLPSPIPESQPPASQPPPPPSPTITGGPSYFARPRSEQPSPYHYGSGGSRGGGNERPGGAAVSGSAGGGGIVGPYVTTGGDGDWR